MHRVVVSAALAAWLISLPCLALDQTGGVGPMGTDGAPMVLIPAGTFPMGVPSGDRDGGRDEYPRHEVYVDAFHMDLYEVTNGRYLDFVKATNHRVPQNPRNPTRNLWEGPAIADSLRDRPVVNVDWS